MRKHFIIALLLCCAFYQGWGNNLWSKQKHSAMLLTEDYGVLSEKDLALESVGTSTPVFNAQHTGFNYWQCFPRDHLSLILVDTGFSSEDVNWKDTMADLEIRVWITPGHYYEYGLRGACTVTEAQEYFNRWRQLMKEERYVCLSGHFVNRKEKIEGNMPQTIEGWIFDKIKTKKGCDAYFEGKR